METSQVDYSSLYGIYLQPWVTPMMPPMTTNDCPATMSMPMDHHRRRLLTTAQKRWQTPQNEHEWQPTQKRLPPPKNEPRPTTTTHHSPQTMASTHERTQVMQTDDEGPGQRWGTRDNDNDDDNYRHRRHFIFDTVNTVGYLIMHNVVLHISHNALIFAWNHGETQGYAFIISYWIMHRVRGTNMHYQIAF